VELLFLSFNSLDTVFITALTVKGGGYLTLGCKIVESNVFSGFNDSLRNNFAGFAINNSIWGCSGD